MPTITFLNASAQRPEEKERAVEAKEGEALLDVCTRFDANIPFGCQNGICGTCIVRIAKGRETLDAPSEKERNTLEMFGATDEHRLACQCTVHGDLNIEEP